MEPQLLSPEFSCYCGGDNTHKGTPKDMRRAAKNNSGKSYEHGLGKFIFYDNILLLIDKLN